MNRYFIIAGTLVVAGFGTAAIAGGLKGAASKPWQSYGFQEDPRASLPKWDHTFSKGKPEAQIAKKQTDEIVVWMKPGVSVQNVARMFGLSIKRQLRSNSNIFVLRAADPAKAENAIELLRRSPSVQGAYPNGTTAPSKFAFVPNDPYFKVNNPANYPGQWHLVNNTGYGVDVKVAGAWARNITGTGKMIGIVDDSLEKAHPDLAPNYSAADSFDFGGGDADPSPFYDEDGHGTSVAGVAAARGGNGIGVTGVAPFGKLAGLRLDFSNFTDAAESDAIQYHSTGASPAISVKNHSYGYSGNFFDSALEVDSIAASTAAGTIHVVAAGNNRGFSSQDSNKAALQNTPDTIAVAALADDGRFALYSSFGANVFVTAPSSGDIDGHFYGITTTDRTGDLGYSPFDGFVSPDYTSEFGGTSSASPLVAGIMLLGKQANPKLNVRMAKHLLARTSTIVHANDRTYSSDGGWKTNKAGFKFNQNYGFGLINADAFTLMAARAYGVSPLQTESTPVITSGEVIPDAGGDTTFLTKEFTLTSTTPLEDLIVNLNVSHTYRGDIEAYLVSPLGTRSRLFSRAGGDGGTDFDWKFTTNAFWGEIPAGVWKLEVHDYFNLDEGTLNSISATAHMGTILIDDATPVSVTAPAATIMANRDANVKVTFKNTGTSSWTDASTTDYFFLRTFGPEGNTYWTPNLVRLAPGEVVAPGASKTFTFTVRTPSTPGTYNFQWTMRHNGQKTFGLPSLAKSIVVTAPDDDSQYVSITVPANLKKGTTGTAVVTFKNIGTTNWSAAGTDYVSLRSVNPNLNTVWGTYIAKLATGEVIAPGASKTFTFSIKAPATIGKYTCDWRLYRNGKGFFGLPTATKSINVIN